MNFGSRPTADLATGGLPASEPHSSAPIVRRHFANPSCLPFQIHATRERPSALTVTLKHNFES
jgi:hypothetical protein